MFSKKIIYGCEGRGDGDLPYLTRYTLVSTRSFQLCIHVFHRSDSDENHDHPWDFLSIILWRGYNEEVTKNICIDNPKYNNYPEFEEYKSGQIYYTKTKKRKVPVFLFMAQCKTYS